MRSDINRKYAQNKMHSTNEIRKLQAVRSDGPQRHKQQMRRQKYIIRTHKQNLFDTQITNASPNKKKDRQNHNLY